MEDTESLDKQERVIFRPASQPASRGSGVTRQFSAAIIVNLLTFSFGCVLGWLSPVSSTLQSEDSPVGFLSEEELSWLGSLTFVGGIAGTLVWGKAADSWGRKTASYVVAATYLTGWTLALISPNVWCLYIARTLLGMGGSGSLVLAPLYVSETAQDSIRGTLGSFVILAVNIGVVFAYLLGAVFTYRWFTAYCLTIPLIFTAFFYFLPETPSYLWTNRKQRKAEDSLRWLMGGDLEMLKKERLKLNDLVKEQEPVNYKDLVSTRGKRKALLIGLALFCWQQLCAILVILSFAGEILKESGSSIDPKFATLMVGLFQLAASLISTLVVEKSGRKILLQISYFCMGVALVVLGTNYWLNNIGYESPGWIPVCSLSFHVFTYALGAGPIPYVIISETLSPDVRGLATSTIILWGTALAFLSVKIYPSLKFAIGFQGACWFFACWCFFAFAGTFILVPETKGIPLIDILKKLNGDAKTEAQFKPVNQKCEYDA